MALFEQGLGGLFDFGAGIKARRNQKQALRQLTPAYGAYGDYLQNAQGPQGYIAPEFQQQQAASASAAQAAPQNVDAMIDAGYASAYGNLDRALNAAGAGGLRGGVRTGQNLRGVQDVFTPLAAQLESQRAQMGQQTALFNAGNQQQTNIANAGWQNQANAYNAQGGNQFNLANAGLNYQSGLNAYDIERQRQQAMLANQQGLYGARIGDSNMMQQTMGTVGRGFGSFADATMSGALAMSNPQGFMQGAYGQQAQPQQFQLMPVR